MLRDVFAFVSEHEAAFEYALRSSIRPLDPDFEPALEPEPGPGPDPEEPDFDPESEFDQLVMTSFTKDLRP